MFNSRNPIYGKIRINKPPMSQFDLSYEKKFTGEMGKLYPIMIEEMVPGDIFDISVSCVARLPPLVAPLMHEIDLYVYTFFVANRNMWPDEVTGDPPELTDGWNLFLTRGQDGDQTPTHPTWSPTDTGVGTLWDYCGMPVDVTPPAADRPTIFPQYAYNMVWNEYFRDERIQDMVSLDNDDILRASWQKDYFTIASLDEQRGTAPTVGVEGYANFPSDLFNTGSPGTGSAVALSTSDDSSDPDQFYSNSADARNHAYEAMNDNVLDGSAGIDILNLRYGAAIQRFMEANQRSSSRIKDFLLTHYGTAPKDERVDIPEYIGGFRQPMVISEVAQTSATQTNLPTGLLAGHGLSVGNSKIGRYRCKEHGVIISVAVMRPKTGYNSQGIPKQWSRKSTWDVIIPSFANIGDQAIKEMELVLSTNTSYNNTIFGYQERYAEAKSKQDMVCGLMRYTESYDYWNMHRYFSSRPTLNSTFIQCIPRTDMFASLDNEEVLFFNFKNHIKAVRPIPFISNPGMII
jgi:hypothetical protein